MILASVVPVVIAVIIIIAVGVAGYYIAQDRKGKLEIHMPTTKGSSGEMLTGTVKVITKKTLDVRRVFVALICYEELTTPDHSEQSKVSKNTEKRKIYREEYSLLEGEQLLAGISKELDFQVLAPTQEEVEGKGSGKTGGVAVNIGGIQLGKDLRDRRLRWMIEARVDLPGVDLKRSRLVNVKLS